MELADYSILRKEIFNDVYEPAEDTFILVDALEKDFNLIKRLKYVILFLYSFFYIYFLFVLKFL